MTIKEQVKPLPCPFCGRKAKINCIKEMKLYYLSCSTRCSWTRSFTRLSLALKKWNTRSQEPKQFSGYSTETPKGDV